MRAIVIQEFGPPQVLRLEEVPDPMPPGRRAHHPHTRARYLRSSAQTEQ